MKTLAAFAFAVMALAAPVHSAEPASNPEATTSVDAVAFFDGQCAVASTGQVACWF